MAPSFNRCLSVPQTITKTIADMSGCSILNQSEHSNNKLTRAFNSKVKSSNGTKSEIAHLLSSISVLTKIGVKSTVQTSLREWRKTLDLHTGEPVDSKSEDASQSNYF